MTQPHLPMTFGWQTAHWGLPPNSTSFLTYPGAPLLWRSSMPHASQVSSSSPCCSPPQGSPNLCLDVLPSLCPTAPSPELCPQAEAVPEPGWSCLPTPTPGTNSPCLTNAVHTLVEDRGQRAGAGTVSTTPKSSPKSKGLYFSPDWPLFCRKYLH